MRAYFIGGSADLSCREMSDDGPPQMRIPVCPDMPAASDHAQHISPVMRVITETYIRYHLPDRHGELVAVYVFDGDNRQDY